MSKVDIHYLSYLSDIANVGNEKKTRSGDVYSQFGAYMSFDMSEGLPILTTKKMFTKGIIYELLWFLSGDTNIKYLVDHNVHIWTDDAYRWYKTKHAEFGKKDSIFFSKDEFVERIKRGDLESSVIPNYLYGDLGKIYGYKWRNNSVLTYQDTMVKVPVIDADDCMLVSDINTKVVYNNDGETPSNGYEVWYKAKAFALWLHIINNVKNPKSYYTICKRWGLFENFLSDIKSIPFFYEWLRNSEKYVLDTDYYRTQHYSPSTCIFLSNDDKARLNLYMQLNDGENPETTDLRVLNPFKVSHTDQVQNIIDTLKTNPDDRRMLCIAFDPYNLDDVALPPCHIMFQCYSREIDDRERARWLFRDEYKTYNKIEDMPTRELSLSFYCRSQDFPLGTPYNITSYALLAHMIAHVVGMSVGDLNYIGGDIHIYKNQLEGVEKHLSNIDKMHDLPTLTFNRKVESINDFNFEDFCINNYVSEGVIKFPLSVG